jgi:protein-disulfide isomerase
MNIPLKTTGMTTLLLIWASCLLITKHEALPQPAAPEEKQSIAPDQWEQLAAHRAPVLGDRQAPFRIVEFSDYQCPFCRAAEPILNTFVATHPTGVAVYRYDMPLTSIHRHAYSAAVAANCADRQGVGEPYQSRLFEHQQEFEKIDWSLLAKQVGVNDIRSFEDCIRTVLPTNHIQADLDLGKSLGLSRTPTIFVNGELLSNSISANTLSALYDKAEKDRPRHEF